MSDVDVILVKPGSQKQLYGGLSDYRLTAIEPPLWLAIWAGFLRDKGYSVLAYDGEAENWTYEEAAQKIADANPLLVIIVVSGTNPSASTMNMIGAGKIATLIRQEAPGMKTMLAGLHPSVLPGPSITEEDVDFVCQGEGFYTLPKLIDALKNNAHDYPIEGLWYKKGDEVISNPRPPLQQNLDEIPMPAWDLLPMEKYRAHNWHCFDDIKNRQPYGVLYTSLGCPFRCSFCCINAFFGKNTIRYRSIEAVINEIDVLVNNFGIKNIKIIDEMFALNEKKIVALCDAIIERKYGLNMWAYARVDTVTKKMLAKMKEAGINWVAYGFESGSKKVIESVSKGYDMDRVEKVVQMTYALDMHICANYIFGLPEDDYGSMNDTLSLMIDINAEWSNIYSAMAFPGSKLYDIAIQNKWALPRTWEGYSQYSYECLPLPTKSLTGGQVLDFRDYAFKTYYNNPGYQDMIKNKFGDETFRHIREMVSYDLKRQNHDS